MTTPDDGGTPITHDLVDPVHAAPAQASTAQASTVQVGAVQVGAAQTGAVQAGARADTAGTGQPLGWRYRVLTAAVLVLVAAGLFACYFAVSSKIPVTSDGAGNALQAWSMLHGNWLLQGWWLSDVSFYTTELPVYLLVEIVRGLTPDVVHVAAALTYTLLVFGAAWLAKGRTTGREAIARMLLAGGIMLAPQVGAAKVLLLAPDHFGSTVPVLAVLLLLDRAPSRWWVPTLTGLVLTGALVADSVLTVTAVLPLLAICGGRVCYDAIRHRPLRSRWLELALCGAAVAAVALSMGILAVINASGGFKVWPVRARLVPVSRMITHVQVLPRGIGLLFGVTTTGHSLAAAGLAALHLAGLGLAIWGVGVALWRFRGLGLVDRLLVSTALINLLSYLLFTPGAASYSARDYSAVLPLSAALAGRMVGKRLLSARLAPVAGLVLAGYLLSLATAVSAPAAQPRHEHLVRWLAAHHLYYGLGGYGAGNATSLATGNRVHVVVVTFSGGRCYPLQWEAQRSDFDPRLHDATFIVQAAPTTSIEKVFGTPDHVYLVGGMRVLVWNKNLLREVQPPSRGPGKGAPGQHALLMGPSRPAGPPRSRSR